ncbi:unnamed protein product [Urochloa decumbens]|uniref:Uncharacterized protein n=1 Tax=Urochloa decumbens TaxID=240449 RepID=A0ABC9GS93_9POAL
MAAAPKVKKAVNSCNPPWAMVTRFHAGYFRISLALSGQALLWRTLTSDKPSSSYLPQMAAVRSLPSAAFLLLWSLALLALLLLLLLYAARCLLRFAAVRAEFRHHVAMNYLFAPWISCLLLLQSAPFFFLRPDAAPYRLLWCAFSLPILALDVKIYGQWFTRGRKFLSMVANPASHITVIGNLVTARAAARMGWHEGAVAIFAVGAAHYLVLFVTLYQRFLGSDSLPAMLRPVFFLFFAAPSMASLAWDAIASSFDTCCKMLFFVSLFLFASLAARRILRVPPGSVPACDASVQRGMVGLLVPADGAGAGVSGVRAGGAAGGGERAHAGARRALRRRHPRAHALHRPPHPRPAAPRRPIRLHAAATTLIIL